MREQRMQGMTKIKTSLSSYMYVNSVSVYLGVSGYIGFVYKEPKLPNRIKKTFSMKCFVDCEMVKVWVNI